MTTAFESATAVEAIGEGRYLGAVAPGWDIAGNANGGYLMALAVRAMVDLAGRPPLTVTTHFLAPANVGACEVQVEIVRAGRRTATALARVTGGDRLLALVLGTFGDPAPEGVTHVVGAPPELSPFEECERTQPPVETGDFGRQVHVRVRPRDAGFFVGRPSGVAEMIGWFSFADAEPAEQRIDVVALMQVADAFPPVCFNYADVPSGWAPTLELTVHVRGVPAPGALLCRFASRFMAGGMFEEDGEMWDSTGRLVAQSRQLALIPRD